MDMSCWTTTAPYCPTYCLHCKHTKHSQNCTSVVKFQRSYGTPTISDMPGPSKSHWSSIFWIRSSTKEELALASAWASVKNLTQSWHTSLFYRKGRFRTKLYSTQRERRFLNVDGGCTCFEASDVGGSSCLSCSWGNRSPGTLRRKGAICCGRSASEISFDLSSSWP